MKKLICLLLIYSNLTFAECNPKTDIKETPQGYLFTEECYLAAGTWKKESEQLKKDNEKLNKSIELKDLAIDQSQQRIQLWTDTTMQLEEKVNKIESSKAFNQWLYFGIGVILTSGAVYGASQLIKR